MDKIRYHFFDKTFSESDGVYYSNNLDPQRSERNRLAVMKALSVDKLLVLKQTHGKVVVDADLLCDFSEQPEADAAVTSCKGLALSIQTADCVPVLLLSDKVVGAAHCGWRSAKQNILHSLVDLMTLKGALNISAIIGPAIQQGSYEVGPDFYEEILQSEPAAELFFKPILNKYLFDLPGFVMLKLKQLNIVDVVNFSEDTYTNPEKYPSYRRDVHSGKIVERRNLLSTVMISH